MKLNYERKVKHMGKVFICRMFYSVDRANLFMAINKTWGVLKVVGRNIYIAKMTDKGKHDK